MSNYEMVVEELESQISQAETETESASSYADDAATAAREAEQHADNACGAIGEMQTLAESLGDECAQLVERVETLETELESAGDSVKLQRVIDTLETALKFERAKFARIIEFISAIATESITLDSTPIDES
jgi:chromosome segregation ATPase